MSIVLRAPNTPGSFGLRWSFWSDAMDRAETLATLEDLVAYFPNLEPLGYSTWLDIFKNKS